MRASIEVETLLKVILLLVIVWIALEILSEVLGLLLGPLSSVFGLIIIDVIILWWFDYV